MNEEVYFIMCRDCFTAGYTFPQFCRDLNIKKPLFLAIDEYCGAFMWEVYVQFCYDKQLSPQFGFLNKNVHPLNFSSHSIINSV